MFGGMNSSGRSFQEYLSNLTSAAEAYDTDSYVSHERCEYRQETGSPKSPGLLKNEENSVTEPSIESSGNREKPENTGYTEEKNAESGKVNPEEESEIPRTAEDIKGEREKDEQPESPATAVKNPENEKPEPKKSDSAIIADEEENRLPQTAGKISLKESREMVSREAEGEDGETSDNADIILEEGEKKLQNSRASENQAQENNSRTAASYVVPDGESGRQTKAGTRGEQDGKAESGDQGIVAGTKVREGSGTGKEGPRLKVIDARTDQERRELTGRSAVENQGKHSRSVQPETGNSQHTETSGKQDFQEIQQQTMQTFLKTEGGEGLKIHLQSQSTGESYQNQLVRQLKEQFNSEIVKKGSILVRSNGSGEIRLDLKPDNLGQVRIRLSMENNNIAGKILVENINVKEAFDQNMQELYKAFKEHGFDEMTLNVSVGDQRRQGKSRGEKAAESVPAGEFGPVQMTQSEHLRSVQNGGEERLIDMLA